LPVFVDPYAVSAASPVEVRVVRNRSHMEKPNTINSALLALSIVGIAATEIGMLRALTPESYMAAIRWFQVPIWSGYVAVVGLVYLRLRPRRLWLGWLALGLRSVALVATFASAPSLNYATLTAVEHITLLGETVAIPVGVPNPWMLTGQASLVVLALFVIDGGLSAWRRGEGAQALALPSALLLLLVVGTMHVVTVFWDIVRMPILTMPLFMGVALVMASELSLGMRRATRAEHALRETEHRLSLAAEAADAGLWSLDSASGKVWATAKTRDIFAFDPDGDLRLEHFLDRVHDQDRLHLRQVIDQALLNSGEKFRTEFRVVYPDGSARWLVSIGRCRATSEGGTKTLMGVMVDITARKAFADEARRLQAQLERVSKVATVTELSASIAHELNQPLAMILTNAEAAQSLLARERPNLEEIADILTDIANADRRAAAVIRRLRALIQRGEPQREHLLLNDAIHEVLGLLRNDLDDQSVTIDLDLVPNLPAVRADRILIEQALLNLITNACEAVTDNPPGERRVTLVTRADADVVLAKVTDNGQGVADPKRLFDTFYTTKATGLGMGLAIVRSIASSHGGRVWAKSAPVHGATFYLSLPRTDAAP
jgi:two-component system sensor kinase FixL